MKIGYKPSVLNFIEKKNLVFFRPFFAHDKWESKLKIKFDKYDEFTSIKAYNNQKKEVGHYDIEFKKDERSIFGSQLLVNDERKHIGQLLTLSSLITMAENGLNHFKLFSLKESIPFHTKLGFIIQSDNPHFICDGLAQIIKSKLPNIDDFKFSAHFLYPQIAATNPYTKENEEILKSGCKLLSNFMKYIGRNKIRKGMPRFDSGCYMDYSDWEIHINREFLNSLTKHHNIDYKF
ncbi:MAG: hypothetical protein E7Z87_01295 [Cyanobacteria bacterium SIG26]|nr:hypothetical protein [Cyanobacteria bacterium SIG26]